MRLPWRFTHRSLVLHPNDAGTPSFRSSQPPPPEVPRPRLQRRGSGRPFQTWRTDFWASCQSTNPWVNPTQFRGSVGAPCLRTACLPQPDKFGARNRLLSLGPAWWVVPKGVQTGDSGLPGAVEVAVPGYRIDPPELVPVLSRGKHRSPRKGACFMELASYLAGERWSAHPACTHPLLAALARDVNDHTPDAGLARLAVLAPSGSSCRAASLSALDPVVTEVLSPTAG